MFRPVVQNTANMVRTIDKLREFCDLIVMHIRRTECPVTARLDVDQPRTFIAGARSPLGVKGDIPVPLAHFRFYPGKQTSTVYEYTPYVEEFMAWSPWRPVGGGRRWRGDCRS